MSEEIEGEKAESQESINKDLESAEVLTDLVVDSKRVVENRVYIKSLELKNYRSYETFKFDFTDSNGLIKKITGLFGPNGSGKSTMLEAVELLFSRYFGKDADKTKASLSKYIRNVNQTNYLYNEDEDFEIKAQFITSFGEEYESVFSREQIVSGTLPHHHHKIIESIRYQCYKTRYDQELRTFQLRKENWSLFKELFETVTGYIVEERGATARFIGATIDLTNSFDSMGCQKEYITGLTIHKPCETITDRECSDGEKKIIKNFTTMLNYDFVPSILLIDNIEMHIQLGRHGLLIDAIEKCFPNSQIIFTTHSPLIISKFNKDDLFDLGARTDRGEDAWRSKLNRVVENASIVAGGLDFAEVEKAISKLKKDGATTIAKSFIDECYRVSIRNLNDL